MTNEYKDSNESGDLESAIKFIVSGDLSSAKKILLTIIKNTPDTYQYQSTNEKGDVTILFWDQQEFLHYVSWERPKNNIKWLSSIYPRAYYFLGFIAVAQHDYQAAINYLDLGAQLEPNNPKFKCEKAQALMGLKNMRMHWNF